MVKNLCSRKSVKKPNRCKKVKGCKVASGPKRTYCRKRKNKTKKTRKIRASVKSLKGGKKRSKKTKRKKGGGTGCVPQPFVGAPYGSNLSELPGVSGPHDGNYYSLNKLDVQPQMDPISERNTLQAIDFKGGKRTRKSKKGRKYKVKQRGGLTGLFQSIGHDFSSAYSQFNGEPVPPNPLPYEDQIYYGNRMPDNLAYLKTKITGE